MLKSMSNCLGCGIELQNLDINQAGYVKSLDQPFCQSCFRLMHYGDAKTHYHPSELPTFNKDALIFVVTSVLYLDTILTSSIKRLNDDYKVVFIINQIDLLPKSTNLNILVQNIRRQFKEHRVSFEDIILMNAHNPYDIEQLKSYILEHNILDIYFIGLQNSGKTTIFKALTQNKDALAMNKAALTLKPLKGTFENRNIYDTPGLYQSGFLHEFLDYSQYKDLLPSKEMKPKNGRLKENEALIIHGLVSVSVVKGEILSVLYGSEHLKYHITQDNKVKTQLTNPKLFNPIFSEFETVYYTLKEDKKYQITLADFGILIVKGVSTLKIEFVKGLHITLTEGFFR